VSKSSLSAPGPRAGNEAAASHDTTVRLRFEGSRMSVFGPAPDLRTSSRRMAKSNLRALDWGVAPLPSLYSTRGICDGVPMSVVMTEHDHCLVRAGEDRCANCHGVLRPPFLEWHFGSGAVGLCAKCCQQIKHGLVADLMRIVAIAEQQARLKALGADAPLH
jgi:hypothetical protein